MTLMMMTTTVEFVYLGGGGSFSALRLHLTELVGHKVSVNF